MAFDPACRCNVSRKLSQFIVHLGGNRPRILIVHRLFFNMLPAAHGSRHGGCLLPAVTHGGCHLSSLRVELYTQHPNTQRPRFVYTRGRKVNLRIETRTQTSPLPPLGDDLPASVNRLFSCRARTTIGWVAWTGRAWGPASTSCLKKSVSCYCLERTALHDIGSREARGDSPFVVNLVYSFYLDVDDYASLRMMHIRLGLFTCPASSWHCLWSYFSSCHFFGEDGVGEALSGPLFRCVLLDGQVNNLALRVCPSCLRCGRT